MPTAVSTFPITLSVGHRDDQFMLQVRTRVSGLQKLSLVRNAGRIDFIVANIKAIKIGGDVGDHFTPFRFDPIVSKGSANTQMNDAPFPR